MPAVSVAQVHIFSRNCEDRTGAYPDVTQQMLEATQGEWLVSSCGEAE